MGVPVAPHPHQHLVMSVFRVWVCSGILKFAFPGAPGWVSWLSVNFGSGHHLVVCEFKPCVGLCADNSEPGVCCGFCVSLSLCAPAPFALCLSLKNKQTLKKFFFNLHFPDDYDVEHFFICLFAICIFFGEVSVKAFCLLFNQVEVLSVLCIFWMTVLYQLSFAKIFSHSVLS